MFGRDIWGSPIPDYVLKREHCQHQAGQLEFFVGKCWKTPRVEVPQTLWAAWPLLQYPWSEKYIPNGEQRSRQQQDWLLNCRHQRVLFYRALCYGSCLNEPYQWKNYLQYSLQLFIWSIPHDLKKSEAWSFQLRDPGPAELLPQNLIVIPLVVCFTSVCVQTILHEEIT